MFYPTDVYYILLVLPAAIIALWAQWNVSSSFKKYSNYSNMRGYTACDVARMILDRNGLQDVQIERVSGNLSDHYDPKTRVVRLSDSVYASTSVAALGVAAHEVGHAIQHQQGYVPLKVRSAIVPITQIGSTLSWPIILIGFFMNSRPLVIMGIALFSLVALFQLITLPVEYNASNRALATLSNYGILQGEDLIGAQKVLNAAALTYVAALIVTIANLLRVILLAKRRND
jgi:uncharacterized protein